MITKLVPTDGRRRPWVEDLEVDPREDREKSHRDAGWTPGDVDLIEQQVAAMALRDDDTGRSLRAMPERKYYMFVQWLTRKDFGELNHAHSVDAKAKCRAKKMARGEYVRRPRLAKKDEITQNKRI